MKKLLKLLGLLFAILLLYALIAIVFFDSKCHIEKSMVINAPKEKVWTHINSMKAFNTWNPWLKLDPNLVLNYTGKSGEIGDAYHWKGNDDVGEGEQEITAITPMEKITTKMHFIKPMEDTATSDLLISPENNTTKVTWTIDFELSPVSKIMKPLLDYQMKKTYQKGLTQLKTLAEK